MTVRLVFIALVSLFALAAVSSCQSAPQPKPATTTAKSTAAVIVPNVDQESTLEISYLLGHDAHRFVARHQNGNTTAQSFLNDELLKEASIDASRYIELLTEVNGFVTAAQRSLASKSDCRGPFTIILRQGAEIQTLRGCRSQDQGSDFSRLTRDAEFLLYSKK